LLAHARRLIAARSKRSKLEHIQLAIEFWEDQIADPDLSAKERQNAQVQLQNLMGIGGSFNVADTDTPDETAEQIRGALKEIETKHKDADEE
jgi:hypothetical protein